MTRITPLPDALVEASVAPSNIAVIRPCTRHDVRFFHTTPERGRIILVDDRLGASCNSRRISHGPAGFDLRVVARATRTADDIYVGTDLSSLLPDYIRECALPLWRSLVANYKRGRIALAVLSDPFNSQFWIAELGRHRRRSTRIWPTTCVTIPGTPESVLDYAA
jgi:hypothetical protein